jgi:DNA-binding MarR family transcriptional regulator
MDLNLVDALAQLSFLVQNTLAEIAGKQDLSLVQVRLLGVLRDREPTMNQLGRHLGLDKSSISGLVDRAERRGLVARSVSPSDRRMYQVSVTEAGREVGGKVAAEFAARLNEYVATFSDAERAHLAQLATRILAVDADRRQIDLGHESTLTAHE